MTRFSKLYLADTVETNGDLYRMAIEEGYDMHDFIEFYLNSRLRELLDEGNALFLTMLGSELLEELERIDNLSHHVTKTDTPQDSWKAEWLGNFYTLLQWKLGITSKECVKKYPPEKLIRQYNPLHDLDMELAINRIVGRDLEFIKY